MNFQYHERPQNIILLCATQRCGSTLLVEDIKRTNVLGNPREHFINWRVGDEKDWGASLSNIIDRSKTPNGVSSFKIMAKQLRGLEYGLSHIFQTDSQTLFPHVAEYFKDSTFIYLKRENVVAQGISREMARQTGINHATAQKDQDHFAGNLMKGYTSSYNNKAQYKFSSLRNASNSVIYENLLWERFFAQNEISPIRMTYEINMNRSKREILDDVARAAKIDISKSSISEDRTIVKLSNSKNEEWEAMFFDDLLVKEFS